MKEFLEKLRTDAWRTSCCRYDGSRRLIRRELFSTISLSMFSALTIAVALIQKVYRVSPDSSLDNYLTALTGCLGLSILVISLIEWGVANGVRASTLFRSAEELNSFQREVSQKLVEFNFRGSLSFDEVNRLREKYEHIKSGCPDNHDPIDDRHVMAVRRLYAEFLDERGKPRIGWWEDKVVRIRWNASAVSYFGLFWLVVGFLIVLAFFLPRD
jgi:hypothetical protein